LADIFISYASADRERARQLADTLTRRGYQVWWDRTIPPGRVFDEVIQEALHAAKCIIVLWSAQSVRSNWVKTEAAEGVSLGRLVPALIERVQPPIEFKRIQAADLAQWSGDGDDDELRKLLASVDRLLQQPLDGARTSSPSIPADERTHRPQPAGSRRTWAVAGVVLLLAVAGGAYLLARLDGRTPPAVASSASDPGPVEGSAAAPRLPANAPVAAQPASTPGRPDRINLLGAENGGEIVTAPDERWSMTVDGKEDTYAWVENGAAVFSFKDGKAATFDAFAVLIPSASENNLRDFELLAGNEGAGGRFDPIGTFSTQNIRIMKQPYQEFRFAPVKAKYLKVRALKSHANSSGAVLAYEFRLLGTLE
jgi:hypothetical protein